MNSRFLSMLLCSITISLFPLAPVQAADLRAEMLKAADANASGAYVRTRFLKQMKKPFNNNDKRKRILIIGDSHAQDFYNAVIENPVHRKYQISTRYIPTICQMHLGDENINSFRDKRHHATCAKADSLKQAKTQVAQADIVILAANWKEWSAQRLPDSIQQLNIKPRQKLFVIGRKSFGKLNIRKYMRMPPDKLKKLRNPVDAKQQKINRLMRSNTPASRFIDLQRLLCQSEKDCPVFTSEGRLISFDGGHFTPQGARFAGQILFSKSPLRVLR